MIGANQHSPAREACLLTRRGGWGLGAEARASEVGSQGEDWGWLREHSLKGLVHHSYLGGSLGKGPPEKGVLEEEKKKGSEKIFEEIIVENFPNMGKEIVNQVQEAQRAPYRINPRRNMPRHILIKLSKLKYKEIY